MRKLLLMLTCVFLYVGVICIAHGANDALSGLFLVLAMFSTIIYFVLNEKRHNDKSGSKQQ